MRFRTEDICYCCTIYSAKRSTATTCPLAFIHIFCLTRSLNACERTLPLHADPNVKSPCLAMKPKDTIIFWSVVMLAAFLRLRANISLLGDAQVKRMEAARSRGWAWGQHDLRTYTLIFILLLPSVCVHVRKPPGTMAGMLHIVRARTAARACTRAHVH